jgi:hypothetical protein
MDASLGDGDATLLHHFVDGRPIHVGHLVELVNADNTPANKSLLSRVLKRRLSSSFSSEIFEIRKGFYGSLDQIWRRRLHINWMRICAF